MRLFLNFAPANRWPVARIIGLLALVCLLQACSAIKTVYGNAPSLVHWWVDGYVDLDKAQSAQLYEDLAQLQAWHRRQELPRYADLLQRLAAQMPGPLDAGAWCSLAGEVRTNLERVAVAGVPGAAALATRLQPSQLQVLARKHAKTNADYRSKWLDGPAEKLRERRFVQALERIEMVYGRLDEAQRTVLQAQLDRSRYTAQQAYAGRLQRQQDLLATLHQVVEGPMPAPAAQAALQAVARRGLYGGDAAARAETEGRLQETCQAMAAVHASTTPAQRDNATRRLQGYASDFRILAARS